MFDSEGVETKIDTDSRAIVTEPTTDDVSADLVVSTRISPSNLLKFQLRMKPTCLQFSRSTHVTITPRDVIITPRDVTQIRVDVTLHRQRELNFLKANFGTTAVSDGITRSSSKITQSQITQEAALSRDLQCPLCSDSSLTRDTGLQVTCSNSHTLQLDPTTGEVVDPFTGVLCEGCGVVNSQGVERCGACKGLL